MNAEQPTCKNRQQCMATNGLHTAVRKHNNVEEDSRQTQGDDDKAQSDYCLYYINGLRSDAILQH